MDLPVEHSAVVEVKSVDVLAPIHQAQTLSSLRVSAFKLAMPIKFSVPVLKDGIQRVINRMTRMQKRRDTEIRERGIWKRLAIVPYDYP